MLKTLAMASSWLREILAFSMRTPSFLEQADDVGADWGGIFWV